MANRIYAFFLELSKPMAPATEEQIGGGLKYFSFQLVEQKKLRALLLGTIDNLGRRRRLIYLTADI